MNFGGLGGPELVIILLIVLVLFGAGKLAGVGGALGTSIREFRDGIEGRSKQAAPGEDSPASETKPN